MISLMFATTLKICKNCCFIKQNWAKTEVFLFSSSGKVIYISKLGSKERSAKSNVNVRKVEQKNYHQMWPFHLAKEKQKGNWNKKTLKNRCWRIHITHQGYCESNCHLQDVHHRQQIYLTLIWKSCTCGVAKVKERESYQNYEASHF